MADQHRIFQLQRFEELGQGVQRLIVHEAHGAFRFREHLRLPIAIPVVNERAAAGRGRNLRREVAPLPDRAESFVEKYQRRLAARTITRPFVSDRAARRSRERHAANVARDNRRLHAFHYLAGADRHAPAVVGQLDRGARGAR